MTAWYVRIPIIFGSLMVCGWAVGEAFERWQSAEALIVAPALFALAGAAVLSLVTARRRLAIATAAVATVSWLVVFGVGGADAASAIAAFYSPAIWICGLPWIAAALVPPVTG